MRRVARAVRPRRLPRPGSADFMWFTRVSLQNPVFATMVMLAFVVLGLFSLQRLKVDQFPNIDFPVVVVTAEYPGAAPEIVESEVTKKIEEAVNSIAGINALTSRSYENQSVVIIEFQLHIDGRKAAEDVRELDADVAGAHDDDGVSALPPLAQLRRPDEGIDPIGEIARLKRLLMRLVHEAVSPRSGRGAAAHRNRGLRSNFFGFCIKFGDFSILDRPNQGIPRNHQK